MHVQFTQKQEQYGQQRSYQLLMERTVIWS